MFKILRPLILLLVLCVPTAFGAVAFDAFTSISQTTGDMTTTHTPVSTPKAAIVYIVTNGVNVTVSGVTYGGVAMTQCTNSPVSNVTGELGSSHCYFLGSGIPTGAQTVSIDMLLGTEVSVAGIVTLTAARDTSVVTTTTVLSDSTAVTTNTLSLGGVSSFCMTGFWSGLNAVTNITPLTSWNSRFENDFGNQTAGIYTYDTIGTADVSAGYSNSGSDDAAMHAIAVRENAAAGGSRRIIMVE